MCIFGRSHGQSAYIFSYVRTLQHFRKLNFELLCDSPFKLNFELLCALQSPQVEGDASLASKELKQVRISTYVCAYVHKSVHLFWFGLF